MSADYEKVLQAVEDAVASDDKPRDRLKYVVEIVRGLRELYDWVGIYYLRGGVLELGPFSGVPTSHTRIPVGRGVCGTAVQQRRNQIVDDVRGVPNYLACSAAVRSEIVVLVWHEQEVVGEIDIDSDTVAAFGYEDEKFLDTVAALIAPVVAEAN